MRSLAWLFGLTIFSFIVFVVFFTDVSTSWLLDTLLIILAGFLVVFAVIRIATFILSKSDEEKELEQSSNNQEMDIEQYESLADSVENTFSDSSDSGFSDAGSSID